MALLYIEMVVSTHEENPPGWPRPWLEHPSGRRPLPWILGSAPIILDAWITFDMDRARRAHTKRLCFCCGLPLAALIVLGCYRPERKAETLMRSDGPGGHPRCLALALGSCPHLASAGHRETITYLYEGSGLGYSTDSTDPTRPFDQPVRVDPEARPLTREALLALAVDDPEGRRSRESS